eukprot:CAMPEP_0202978168 /NCGR_PEP_ID=MMETSP1396-20130829/84679_1 /ASSEMBLY_ACC=CAM_ASM_000872 /TAXON_ID= /ORGANISM="Pseudokeronopsis sp., Strain Brazil" /LENGTH=87 /DNA_ID=CAMNT_0049717045 /DNA_START=3167 /DNA_END=3430 /DNA_ORIENTATION=-
MIHHERDVIQLLEESMPEMSQTSKQVNLSELGRFLDKHGLQFLKDNFDGSLSLRQVASLDEVELQNVVQGEMYAKRLKEKLNLLNGV